MKFNRSRTDIISSILKIANGGVSTKTKIMYHAFLSHAQMKDYLIFLTQHDLIEYDVDAQYYKTTEKGLRFLDIYNQLDGMIKAPPAQPSPLLPTTTSRSSSLLQEQQQEQVS
jgi:predicted transcriptional regulator